MVTVVGSPQGSRNSFPQERPIVLHPPTTTNRQSRSSMPASATCATRTPALPPWAPPRVCPQVGSTLRLLPPLWDTNSSQTARPPLHTPPSTCTHTSTATCPYTTSPGPSCTPHSTHQAHLSHTTSLCPPTLYQTTRRPSSQPSVHLYQSMYTRTASAVRAVQVTGTALCSASRSSLRIYGTLL